MSLCVFYVRALEQKNMVKEMSVMLKSKFEIESTEIALQNYYSRKLVMSLMSGTNLSENDDMHRERKNK